MKIICEISKPHYHPGPGDHKFTKKRDLSVPPNWVANERVEKDGKSYAVVMPPRDEELWEERQAPHIHLPEQVYVKINDEWVLAKLKVGGQDYIPRMHFDDKDALAFNVINNQEIEL